jgi:ferric-dicitrate binding protein FerR (iron transport regulator)
MPHALDLLHRHLDGLAAPDETAELFRLVVADAGLADAWARLVRIEVLVEEVAREDWASARAAALLTSARPVRRRRARVAVMALAAILVLALGAALLRHWRRSAEPAPPAMVSGKIRVDGRETDRFVEGEKIEVFGAGTAVLRLPDGTRAELEPASEIVLRGHSDGPRPTVDLGRGRGTFQVGSAGGLAVRTPLGVVTAARAEFSVELQPVSSEDAEDLMLNRGTLLLVVAALVGDVEVSSDGRHYVLGPGQSRAFAADGKEVTGKPQLGGKVVAVAPDGTSLTIETPPPKKGGEPTRTIIKFTDRTKFEYRNLDNVELKKPAVGLAAAVWLVEGTTDTAATIRLEAVPVILTGRVTAVAPDGKSFMLTIAGKTPDAREIRIGDGAKVVYRDIEKGAQRPTVGYDAQVWLRYNTKDIAGSVQFFPPGGAGKPDPEKKPPPKEPAKPDPDKRPPAKPDPEKKPTKEPPKPDPDKVGKPEKEFPLPNRDPAPAVAAIDREWRRGLDEAKVAPAADVDDAEFLRRVSLDLTGRVPSWKRARAFLDSTDPDKRRRLVDELLASPAYGEHLAGYWRRLIMPPDDGVKPQPDVLSPWLAEQFNKNRGWGEIVRELITADGAVRSTPQLAFTLANGEVLRPKPEMLADATSRLFLGVELRCAQCHDHPFSSWQQADFWGLAAFYGRVNPDTFKGGGNVKIGEMEPPPDGERPSKGVMRPEVKGPAIFVTAATGRQAGKVVRARFPRGAELGEDVPGPYRPRLVDWMTARDNPYFARAAVNRLWAQMFGRGLVMPLDGFDENNPPSNAALLDALAKEFADSDYDMKHLLRCLCLSQAYQRTSRTRPYDAAEDRSFSRMAVKPLGPEALFDSLQVVSNVDKGDPAQGRWPGSTELDSRKAREQFVRFFRTQNEDGNTGGLNQGIPQALRLMNGPTLNAGAPIVDSLVARNVEPAEGVETLFLVAYARRPSAAEVELFKKYLAKQPSAREGYTGMLWVLLNSSEFLLNH